MMMTRLKSLFRNSNGSAAVEFALALPLTVTMLLGALNMGIYLFFQNSLSSALDETARSVTVWPIPNDTELQTEFTNNLLSAQQFGNATLAITHGTDTFGRDYVDLVASGGINVNLVFVDMGTMPVRLTKRSYPQL
ncbi:pilus assembly protein [Qipengyuania gaetbuli]|uniref:TadE/TadG family type IV pilus assembly protein n=1 Tax=Qipengyuania gaetbuli TaxID=266952 RepID=UPI001C99339E|nr:TadE/TadG family type IV pilus assembly protein [Qipengyuania gaetbuli]MBY6013748.1 pilus assembly protein [Qipengyuania gaetbuli]